MSISLEALMNQIRGIHQKIAEDVWPDGAILHCKVCEHTREITTEACAEYLKHGWPKHCDEYMLVEKR